MSCLGMTSGVLGLAAIPGRWVRPVVNAVVLPAHARTSATPAAAVDRYARAVVRYTRGDQLPFRYPGTGIVNFSGDFTIGGVTYTCVSEGKCEFSHNGNNLARVHSGVIERQLSPVLDGPPPPPVPSNVVRVYTPGQDLPFRYPRIDGQQKQGFSGEFTIGGETYICLSEGKCEFSAENDNWRMSRVLGGRIGRLRGTTTTS